MKLDELKRVSANYEAGVIFPREKDHVSPALPDLIAAVEALSELTVTCEIHDAAIAKIMGKPKGWTDSYLDKPRDILSRLGVE